MKLHHALHLLALLTAIAAAAWLFRYSHHNCTIYTAGGERSFTIRTDRLTGRSYYLRRVYDLDYGSLTYWQSFDQDPELLIAAPAPQ